MVVKPKPKAPLTLVLQWHLTARCQQNCLHCYMKDEPTYASELKNELETEVCFKIIDSFVKDFSPYCKGLRINFTGGDPLLKKGIFELIDYATRKGIWVGILGNPNLITPKTAKRLKKAGLKSYQISIDGLEKTHDKLRGRKEYFRQAIKCLPILKEADIKTVVMFTLSKVNKNELIPLIKFLSRQPVDLFDFARLVPCGKGKQMAKDMLSPIEYRNLLLRVFYAYLDLRSSKSIYFGRKDSLWNLLYQQLGLLNFVKTDDQLIRTGCGIGSKILTILADGTVYSCRRLPIKIGQIPQQSLKEIFFRSKEHNRLRKTNLLEKCSSCRLYSYCRGCPSVAFGTTGNYFAADPQCWI